MRIQPGLWRRPTGLGFTLVELLLTVALLLLLLGAGVLNFGSLQRGSQLDEGVMQVESLFRYARAQAASTGHLVRVSFGAETATSGPTNAVAAGSQVSWEIDPLGAPGRFEALTDAGQFTAQLDDLVRVMEVRVPTVVVSAPVVAESTDTKVDEEPPASPRLPIMFYPDGSSDSVEIVLTSRDTQDPRRLAVILFGLTGALRHRPLPMSDGAAQPVKTEALPR